MTAVSEPRTRQSEPGWRAVCGTSEGVMEHDLKGTKLCLKCREYEVRYREAQFEAERVELEKQIRSLQVRNGLLSRKLDLTDDTVTIPTDLFARLYLTADLDVAIDVETELGREVVEEAISISDRKGK